MRDTLERERLSGNLIDRVVALETRLRRVEERLGLGAQSAPELLVEHESTADLYRLHMIYDADMDGSLLIAESTSAIQAATQGGEG